MEFDPGGIAPGDFGFEGPGDFGMDPGFETDFGMEPDFSTPEVYEEMPVLEDVPPVPDTYNFSDDVNDFAPEWNPVVPDLAPPQPETQPINLDPAFMKEDVPYEPVQVVPGLVEPGINAEPDMNLEPEELVMPTSESSPESIDVNEPAQIVPDTIVPETSYDLEVSLEPEVPKILPEETLPESIDEIEIQEEPVLFDQGKEQPPVIGPEETELYHSPETTDEIEPGVGPNPSWEQAPDTTDKNESSPESTSKDVESELIDLEQKGADNQQSEQVINTDPDKYSNNVNAEELDNATNDQNVNEQVNLPEVTEFDILDWTDYPDGQKPEGPFRLLDDEEYEQARQEANNANRELHKLHPEWEDLEIHEIHPVKFGGDPTDPANKIAITPEEHAKFTAWWNNVQRELESNNPGDYP
jgi:hypothetical protein